MTNDEIFLRFSAEKLEQLTSRILTCLDGLSPEQVWMRGAGSSNAIGNLVLHLSGNVRQWIGTGVGRLPEVRDRDAEFSARGVTSLEFLKRELETKVAEAVVILRRLDPARLSEPLQVQAYDVTVFEAIYHVVEHFAGHAGQIFFAAKLFTGADLGFYRHLNEPAHGETVP